MNLSAMLILKYLEPLYGLSYGENPSNLLNLGRPVFLLDQEHWPAGRVCICDTVPAYLLTEPVPEDILVFLSFPSRGHRQPRFQQSAGSAGDVQPAGAFQPASGSL